MGQGFVNITRISSTVNVDYTITLIKWSDDCSW